MFMSLLVFHLLVDRRLSCFRKSAAPADIGVHVSVQVTAATDVQLPPGISFCFSLWKLNGLERCAFMPTPALCLWPVPPADDLR